MMDALWRGNAEDFKTLCRDYPRQARLHVVCRDGSRTTCLHLALSLKMIKNSNLNDVIEVLNFIVGANPKAVFNVVNDRYGSPLSEYLDCNTTVHSRVLTVFYKHGALDLNAKVTRGVLGGKGRTVKELLEEHHKGLKSASMRRARLSSSSKKTKKNRRLAELPPSPL